MSKYAIIETSALEKRISELEELRHPGLSVELEVLKRILAKAKPLEPEIATIKDRLFQKLRYWQEEIQSEDDLYDRIDEELHDYFVYLKKNLEHD